MSNNHHMVGIGGYAKGDHGCSNWHPANIDPNDQPVPQDLIRHYRQVGHNRYAYVCPHCKYIFEPWWGGMPGTFRAHISDPDYGGAGCFLKQPSKTSQRKSKGLESF